MPNDRLPHTMKYKSCNVKLKKKEKKKEKKKKRSSSKKRALPPSQRTKAHDQRFPLQNVHGKMETLPQYQTIFQII